MRKLLLAVVAAAIFPTAASAWTTPLTLKAPKATQFGHRIEFVGRLVPAKRGVLVRLYRGRVLVTSGRVRGDGTFRLPVKAASPGPFRVRAASHWSNPVTVRIHPRLETSLVGSRVVGGKLRLLAHLEPAQAGALRVRVARGGGKAVSLRFRAEANVQLGTSELGQLHVRVDAVPRPGYAYVSRSLGVELVPPQLAYGSESSAVAELARRLAALHYAVASTGAIFDANFLETVYAFQKVEGLARDGVVGPNFWGRLEHASVPKPRYTTPADHIEIDKTRQVLFVVRNGEVALISPVSTAGIAGYYTPEGQFAIYRKVVGYDPSPLGVLLDPMYFTGGYAIHGNPVVPPYPASHGCVRVPNFVIFRLFPSEPYGETVYVYH
jgi:N-acetylmuramoyl-L-alanine amidase